jgi:hypothetical protein
MRTLEQKISDAGPGNQRIDPHLLTKARERLQNQQKLTSLQRPTEPWFHLADTPRTDVQHRLDLLEPIHDATLEGQFVQRLGQTLEIAVFKALQDQSTMQFLGAFEDLDQHDDSSLYKKDEPPEILSGHAMPSKNKLDFMVIGDRVIGGIEVKNTRAWIYPESSDLIDLLKKRFAINVVPILIARRIHYSTFSVLNPCGVIVHQTFNQKYPKADEHLAALARDKSLLGYHDIRVGNEPDERLLKFLHTDLPALLPTFRERFERFKDLLRAYGLRQMSYKDFAGRSRRRLRGEPEDFPEPEPPDWWT